MKHKSIKSISFILALLLVILQCGVLSVSAASSSKGKTVYFKLPDEWKGRVDANTGEEILPAAYVAGGTDGQHVPWVGEHMTLVDEANDIWSYTIPGDQTLINFNTGQQRDWQTVDLAIPGGDMIFLIDKDPGTKTATGHWEPYNTDEPVEGMPIISVENCAPALGEEFALNVNLQNVPQLSGYVVNLAFDKNVIAPVNDNTVISSTLGDVIANVKSNGELTKAYDASVVLDEAIFDMKPVLFGDVNGDGDIRINDAIVLQKYLAGQDVSLSKRQLEAAAVVSDGEPTVKDVTRIQQYLAEMIPTLNK